MSTYIALTLGPITRVIALARKTRGMWAASYLFSYLAKHIITPLKDRPFILPYMATALFDEPSVGVGTFPDRYIFNSEHGDFEKLAQSVNKTFNDLAQKLNPKDTEGTQKLLMQYFKVYFFETERDENLEERQFVEDCERRLALLEQREAYVPTLSDSEHHLSTLFNAKNKDMRLMDFLIMDAQIDKFKSIVEITSQDDDNNSLPDLPYQRYIAIVYADGDSMGKAFAEASNSSTLSEQLYQFNKNAIKAIKNFDGQPVFIGGDDLFFFAPIYNPGKGSIFSLIKELDEDFSKALGTTSPATLSYGVSITYVKYPMSEAVRLSKELLDSAKGRYAQGDIYKNNILFSVQKHSGQTRSVILHKGCAATMKQIYVFVEKYIVDKSQGDNSAILLRSVMHNLREHEPVIINAISSSSLLHNYFINNYNEPEHNQFEAFFTDLENLLLIAFNEYSTRIDYLKNLMPPTDDVDNSRPQGFDAAYASIDLAYGLLQFVHLVNSRGDE